MSSIVDLKKYSDEDRAAWFSCLMYYECFRVIYDILEGYKTFDELGIRIDKEKSCSIPQYKTLKHSDLAKKVVDVVQKHYFVKQEDEGAITFFPPVIHSGGFYNLDINCTNDGYLFKDDKNYEFLLHVHNFIIGILTDGIELSMVYQATLDFVQKYKPELLQNLNDNFWSIMNDHPNSENLVVQSNSKGIAQENMIFNVNVGFHDIYDASIMKRPPHTYSLWIGDCAKVEKGKCARILKTSFRQPSFVMLHRSRKLKTNELF